jgi:hypothetical protein
MKKTKIKSVSPNQKNEIKAICTPSDVSDEILKKGMDIESKSSKFNLIIGVLYLLSGMLLIINSIEGSAFFVLKIVGVESHFWDAPIGIILCIIGGLIVLLGGRTDIRINKK